MIECLVSQYWLQKLGWTLLHFLWQGTAIAVTYLVLRAVLGRSLSAQGRYILACLALAAMAIAPAITFLFIPDRNEALPGSLAIPWNISPSAWQRFFPGFVAVWLTGVLGFSIRLFGGWRLSSHLSSEARPAPPEWQRTLESVTVLVKASWSGLNRPVRLLVSPVVGVPTVIGWLRPAILVPASALTGLPVEHITALLAHELAHIRRHDYLANMLQSVAEAFLFYHPAVWWVSGQIRTERELCCDDLAVAASDDALTYASALAQLESIQPSRLSTVLAANGGSLLNRVQRLIEPGQAIANELPGAGSAWAMTLLLLAGVGVATIRAAQKPEPVPQVGNPEYPIRASIRPSPFGALAKPVNVVASHARSTLLFDPFLSAQLARPQTRGTTGDGNLDGNDKAPRFELATVRTSPRAATRMTGGFYGDDRFDVQSAEMLDLIGIAYGVGFDKVVGGPSWLEWDRFDVLAKAPAKSTPETMKFMLRTLLTDRFNLIVRSATREQPTYALTAGRKLQLSEASGTGDSGCKLDFQKSVADGSAVAQTLTYSYTCRNMTMAALGEQIRPLIGTDPNPILDETGLKGSWNFSFKFSFQAATRVAALFDALDKQLGLKLEPRTAPTPVVVVEGVNRKPAADPPGTTDRLLADAPKEFEVADIRPSDPNAAQGGSTGGFQPGGRVTLRGVTLRYLIWLAWNATPDEIVGGPKFLDTDRFDLVAKAPSSATTEVVGEPRVDTSALRIMVRTLLVNRFGLTTHTEERPVPAFTLMALKPKLTQADPANRTAFHERAGTDGKDPRAANPAIERLITCTNMTMAQFAEDLPLIAAGYFGDVSRHVLDATGMDGAYDFTFSFSGASTIQRAGNQGGIGDTVLNGVPQALDPTGRVSLFDALEKQLGLRLELQKRSLPVLVIDHIEQKPTDN